MRGGSRNTHTTRVAAALDEFVIMGHALRHELLGVMDQPAAFEQRLERYAVEADTLKQQTLRSIREIARA